MYVEHNIVTHSCTHCCYGHAKIPSLCIDVYICITFISIINVESVTMEAQQCVLCIAALRSLVSTMNTSLCVKCPLFFLSPPPPFIAKYEISCQIFL